MTTPLNELINELAELFPDDGSARALVTRAELESGQIAFDARATVNWTNIIREARRLGRLDHVVRTAAKDYPGRRLDEFLQEYKQWAATHRTAERRLFVSTEEEGADGAGAVARPASWAAVRERSEKHTRRFLAGQQGTPNAPGTFEPGLYVRRDAAERELARFLEGSAPALALVGDSGVGKTNVLCRWMTDLLEQGHAVLAYDCAALAQADVESEILRDLALPPGLAPVEALERIEEEAADAERSIVIVFDSIGDYRGDEQNGTRILLRRINALAGRTGPGIRVVLSCNAATWSRMERIAPMRLDQGRYFRSVDDEPFVRLGLFTPEELESAYRRYRDVFTLFSRYEDLHPAVRERLKDPVLLRITAETYRAVEQPMLPVNVGLGIYRRFFAERVQTDREKWLVDALAEQMMARRTGALSINELARDDDLGPEILAEDATSTYSRLLDRGVLQESRGNVRAGVLVRFAHDRVAAYALATHLLERKPDVAEKAAELLADDARFPLAWDVARTLLLESGEEDAISSFARSGDLERREMAVEVLVELHADDPKAACRMLEALLDQSEESRRTALKAAYSIGPPARDFFLRAAIEGNASMRESVKNTLYLIWRNESSAGRRSVTDTMYLIWRHSPGFTHDFLNTMIGSLTLRNITRFPAILWFVLDLTITIYINHCEEEEVIEKTAALLHDLSIERLHLDRFNTGFLGAKFEKLVFRTVAAVFGGQILKWMLFADSVPAETFFERPPESRAALGRIADVLDPSSDLESAHEDLVEMLQSDVPVFSGSAAMAIAVHAAHDFRATEPLVRRLWDEVDAGGRLWILVSFSVLLNDTPPEWTGLLEDRTRAYVEQHRTSYLSPASLLPGGLDIVLLPLGLAYGKSGSPVTLFDALLGEGLAAGDTPLVTRTVAALAAVGFYYPDAMFRALHPVMSRLDDAQIAAAVLATLATVRTLHFDAVDHFLDREAVPEDFRHRVNAAAGVTLVHRFIRVLGFYNNAVHLTLRYPRMRRPFSVGALKLLAEARSGSRFITDYTLSAMRLLRESNFQVLEWTRPE